MPRHGSTSACRRSSRPPGARCAPLPPHLLRETRTVLRLNPQPCKETRAHEPMMLRRSAVAGIAPPMPTHARYSLGPFTLVRGFTKTTSRVCCPRTSVGALVIGRGPTHEVEYSSFLGGLGT